MSDVTNSTTGKPALMRLAERFELVMIVVGIVGPFATLPQLVKLCLTLSHHASGQSLTTWWLSALLSLLWLIYGLLVGNTGCWSARPRSNSGTASAWS